jgi:glycosyltransferase involved in cell wall biosynthesis
MKIGIFDPYLDDLGGGEKYMMTIAQDLSKNHEVEVFWDSSEDLDRIKERFGLDFSKVKLTRNIFSHESFFPRLLATRKYDALIFLSDGSIPLSLSRKLFIHVQQPLQQFQSTSLKDKLKLSRVTAFFCNSEFTKSFISEKFGLKTRVIYPAVALHPIETKKENIVLHVGRFRVKNVGIEDYKKQGLMIEAFKEMIDDGLKRWKFVIAASVNKEQMDQFEYMKSTANNYPIEFLVNETNQNLWKIYSKAKIYWHASGYGEDLKKHPEFAEHFGISTVEAMGAGAVPVVINAGGQKEIVTNGENGFLWNDLTELKKQTMELVRDEKLLQKLSKNAKVRSKDFSEETFQNNVQKLICS